MKRMILFLVLGLTSSAFGQITITAAQFLAGYTSGQATGRSYSSEDVNGLPALIGAAGASQSWDFGGRVYTETPTVPGTFIDVFPFPGTAPFANDPDFASSTHVIKTSLGTTDLNAIWVYVRFTEEGYWSVGNAYDSMGTPKKVIAYVPPMQMKAFPLTFGTEWHSTSRIKGPDYEMVYDSITQSVDAKVDGWGTLILPTKAGKPSHSPASSTQALRIESKTTQNSYIQGFSISTVTYNYEWITGSQYSGTITTDESKTPYGITYNTPGTGGGVSHSAENALEIRLGGNPVVAESSISFTLEAPSNININVLDMLGNSLQHLGNVSGHIGQNVIPLEVHTLASGTYFLRVEAGDLRAIRKLVVSR